MFVDSADFIVNTCNMKQKSLLLKEVVNLHELSALFQVNFEVGLKEFLK